MQPQEHAPASAHDDVPLEQTCRQLLEACADYAIVKLDAQGTIVSWSGPAAAITQFAAHDVVGSPYARLFPPEDVAAGKVKAMLRAAAVHGRIEKRAWQVRKDGSRFWSEIIITKIEDPAGALRGYAAVARDGTERARVAKDFVDDQDRMRALIAHFEKASEDERKRLAREIHDGLGQELTGLKLDGAWLARRIVAMPEPGRQPLLERLDVMASQIDSCFQVVRRIAGGLRPFVLDDLGLGAAIEWQAHEFQRRAGIHVELSLPKEDARVDLDRSTAIFRILQELLTNVANHSGASRVSVVLARESHGIVLQVHDNGCGISAQAQARPDALGLLGMRERAAQFGGSLVLEGADAGGTRATLRVPL